MKTVASILCSLAAAAWPQTAPAELIVDDQRNGTWNDNAIMSYTARGENPMQHSASQLMLGVTGTGMLTVSSGQLELTCQEWGAIVGQLGGTGVLTVGGGSLIWNARGFREPNFYIGNSQSTGQVAVVAGTLTINTSHLVIGRDKDGYGQLRIEDGTMICNATSFAFGGGDKPNAGTRGFVTFGRGNGVLKLTGALSAITFDHVGGPFYIDFLGDSGGKLEINGWTQSQFESLVAAGRIRVDEKEATASQFVYHLTDGLGTYQLAAKTAPAEPSATDP